MNSNLKLMLYNVTGLRKKVESIKKYMDKHKIDLCLITETWIKNIDFSPKGLFAASMCGIQCVRGQAGTGFFMNEEKWKGRIKIVEQDNNKGLFSIIEMMNLSVVVVYLPPSLNVEEVASILTQILDKVERNTKAQVIIGGDFNCKIAQLNNGHYCERGRYVNTEMVSRGYELQNKAGQYTNFMSGSAPATIDLWWTNCPSTDCETSVEQSEYLGRSSHKPVLLSIKQLQGIAPNEITRRRILRSERLMDYNVREEVRRNSTANIESLTAEMTEHLKTWKSMEGSKNHSREWAAKINSSFEKKLCKIINENIKNVCGMKTVFSKKSKIIENNSTIQMANRINSLTKLISKFPQKEYLYKKRDSVLTELERERDKIKLKAFEDFDNSIAFLRKPEQQKLFKRIIKTRIGDNELGLDDSIDSMKGAEKYFTSLYRNEKVTKTHNGFNWNKDDEEVENMANEIFTKGAICEFVKFSPSRKAPGLTGITNEIIRALCPGIIDLLVIWFKYSFITGTVPCGWQKALIIPIFKKGDKTQIQNYRPIALLENFRKLFEKCLAMHVRNNMIPLEIMQGGFQPQRGTLDQIACLENIMLSYRKVYRKNPVVCFLDIKAAYDTVDRSILYDNCIEKNISYHVVELLRQLFDFNRASVKIKEQTSSSFTMPSGLQQGSILSPLLYSIFVDKLITELKKGPGLQYEKNQKANCLLYADDIALVARNQSEMNSLLKIAECVSSKKHFQFNLSKCAYVNQERISLWLCGQKITKVGMFTYLGIQVNAKGIDTKAHIKECREKMKRTALFFTRIGLNGKGYRLGTKVTFYKTFIRSKMEYGIAVMKVKKKEKKVIESIQYEILCKLFSVSTKSSYATLQIITGLISMNTRIEILKARWLARYNKLKNSEEMLLPKIEKWSEEIGIVSVMNKIVLESTLQITIENFREEIKTIHNDYFGSIIQNAGFFKKCLTVELDGQKLQRFLKAKIIPKKEIQIICLFLLNKFPCKPNICKICSEKLSSFHLVNCNLTVWENLNEKLTNQFKIRTNFNINEKLENNSLLPYITLKFVCQLSSMKCRKEITNDLVKNISLSFSNCIQVKNYNLN